MGTERAVVGLDGCKAGWVGVCLRPGAAPEVAVVATAREALDLWPDAAVYGFDIPIGWPEPGEYGRAADRAAKAFLGARRSSVFPTPPREALTAPAYATARKVHVRLTGKGLSAQSFALRHKILDVEAVAADPRVVEVHPECSFAVMKGEPLETKKKEAAGVIERLRLLERVGVALPGDLPRVPVDDLLDAAAAAWSAGRFAAGEARPFPEDPPVQEGRRVAIWA